MANRYFGYITGMSVEAVGGTNRVKAVGEVRGIDADDDHSGPAITVQAFIEASDHSQSIHDKLAEAARAAFSDDSIRVVFLDASGRF